MTTEAFYALSPDEQELQIAKHERDGDRCPQCRGSRDRCSDPERPWYPQRTICYATLERESAARVYALMHEARPFHDGTFTRWSEKPSVDFPLHYSDGVNIWVSPVDLSPNDRWTTDPNAPAVAHPDDDEGGEHGDQA